MIWAASGATPTHPALICSDRERLTRLRKQLEPALHFHTAASGDAMISHLAQVQHPVVAAVDISFIRKHGYGTLARCDRSQNVAGLVVFGVTQAHDKIIPGLYRYSLSQVVFGHEPADLIHAVQLAWNQIQFQTKSA